MIVVAANEAQAASQLSFIFGSTFSSIQFDYLPLNEKMDLNSAVKMTKTMCA